MLKPAAGLRRKKNPCTPPILLLILALCSCQLARAQDALSLSSGTVQLPGSWDTNGDGRVTQAEIDAAVARTSTGSTADTVATGFRASCATLLELDGGCAHDLSLADPGLASGTVVSDLCPEECGGHMGCMRTALDVSFLASEESDGLADTSTRDGQIELIDDACCDGGGMNSAAGGARVSMTTQYAQEGQWSVALWVLAAAPDIWIPQIDGGHGNCLHGIPDDGEVACCASGCGTCGVGDGCGQRPGGVAACCAGAIRTAGTACSQARGVGPCRIDRTSSSQGTETLFHHPLAVGTQGVTISLRRGDWADTYFAVVEVASTAWVSKSEFALDILQDEVPRWCHIAVVINDGISAHINGISQPSASFSSEAAVHGMLVPGNGPGVRRDVWLNLGQTSSTHVWQLVNSQRYPTPDRSDVLPDSFSTDDDENGEPFGQRLVGFFLASQTGSYVFALASDDDGELWFGEALGFSADSYPPAEMTKIASVPGWTNVDEFDKYADQTADPVHLERGQRYLLVAFSKEGGGGSDCAVAVTTPGGELLAPIPTVGDGGELLLINPVVQHEQADGPSWNLQLAHHAIVGADTRPARLPFRGSIAMLQLYPTALTQSDVDCVYESGRRLVHGGRMAQTLPSTCRGVVTTGCTSQCADNSPDALHITTPSVDDGSCRFELRESTAGDIGLATVTDDWERISLTGAYANPIVLIGAVSRESTTQSVVRLRNVEMSVSGLWSFELKAEQKSCHFALPPPSLERVSYLVAEGGVSSEGWQAGTTRVSSGEWHRVSYLQSLERGTNDSVAAPVVLSHVQTFDERIGLVTTQHHFDDSLVAFFLRVRGSGIWCNDGEFFAEYFDNLDLSGSPVVTDCESSAPNWHWHSSSGGVPPLMMTARSAVSNPQIFSARWSTRLRVDHGVDVVFASTANQGSRVSVDSVIVLDHWSECCDQFVSNPVAVSGGVHEVSYAYRSAYEQSFLPSDSFAEFSWSIRGRWFGARAEGSSNSTTGAQNELFADVGWLALPVGAGLIHGRPFQAGTTGPVDELVADIHFSAAFAAPPQVFASLTSMSDLRAHLRLLMAAELEVSLALEYDSCDPVFAPSAAKLGWVTIANADGESARINTRATLHTDVSALLTIGESLRLPAFFQWRNASDPCRDRWGGVECRSDSDGVPRITVLDVHNQDLTNQELPWQYIGQLSALEELSMWNCALEGIIVADAVCRLRNLQVLALNKNQLRGVVPECLRDLPLVQLWLSDNAFHGPISEYSPLGQYLKTIESLNLERNRWAPILESEKEALFDVAAPLGIRPHGTDRVHGHNWDFMYSYDWQLTDSISDGSLTADRKESYRHWRAGTQFTAFMVSFLFSSFPWHGQGLTHAIVALDGNFLVTLKGKGKASDPLYVGVLVGNEGLTWHEGREYCRTHHYDLASAHDAAANEAMAVACESTGAGQCWIGANDLQSEGEFEWSDGSAFEFEHFANGEPNAWGNGGAVRCAHFLDCTHACI